MSGSPYPVIPAEAGTHARLSARDVSWLGTHALHADNHQRPACLWKLAWVPASAGMTVFERAPYQPISVMAAQAAIHASLRP